MAIPKIIHYCWFGKKKKPKDILEFIESWKEILYDYEIIEWNESNFDCEENPWMKKTIEEKNYGFSSDYFRYKTLYEYGGIYLDTDVKVIKPLDPFLNHKFFIGYMNDAALATAVIGAEAKNSEIKKILELFDNGKASDRIPSNVWITQFFLDTYEDFILLGKNQVLKSGINIYEKEYFDRPTNKKNLGYCVHYYKGSWYNRKDGIHRKIVGKIIGEVNTGKILQNASLRLSKHYPIYLEFKKRHKKSKIEKNDK